jgi:hypothetical protein
LDEGELAGSVDGHKQGEPAFGGLYLRDVDVEDADRLGLEPLLGWFITFYVGQPADAVALQAAMQG